MSQRLYYVVVYDSESESWGIDAALTKEKFPLRAYNVEHAEWEKAQPDTNRYAARTLLRKLSNKRGPSVKREDVVVFNPPVTDLQGDKHERLTFHSVNRFMTEDDTPVRLSMKWRTTTQWEVER